MPLVTIDNRILSVPEGTLLSSLFSTHAHPCGGKGVCGKCKVRVWGEVSPLSAVEQRHLTSAEIADGIRLSCQTIVLGDCGVETLGDAALTVLTAGEGQPLSLYPGFTHYGAAADIGTTTLAARLYAPDGTLLAEGGAPNPQMAFGGDVLTRVEASQKGQASGITAAVRTGLSSLLADLSATAGIIPDKVEEVVITGNTVMLTLLVGGDVTPFATAPFTGYDRFGYTVTGAHVGLSDCPDATVYLSPCASAFVGGDTATALLATTLPDNGMLVDIGTNGEMVLKVVDTLYACSTAAGPAFEGVGVSCGMVAAPGAIDRVELANGTLHPHVIGGGKATGVCGSGLMDALACLALLGDPTGPVSLAPGVILTAEDVQALLVSKSAIRSGIETLLYTAGMKAENLTGLWIAGGFGSYLNISNARRVGLLPSVPTYVVGNAALDGAAHLLLDTRLRGTLAAQTAALQTVDLAQNPYFAKQFIENMTLEVPQ